MNPGILLFFSVCVWECAITYKQDIWGPKNVLSVENINIPLFHFGDKKYYVGKWKLSYFDADNFCKNIDMQLVAVHSSKEFEALWKYIQKSTTERKFWTSGSILLNDRDWIWMSSMELVKFTKWKPGEPNNRQIEKCLEFLSDDNIQFLFNDRNCDSKAAFICERYNRQHVPDRKTETASTKHHSDDHALPGTVINGAGYRVSNYKATQEEASKDCKKHGMELVSILDKEKSDIITNLISKNLISGVENVFWTSAQLVDGDWVWKDSQSMIYTNWVSPRPDDLDGTEMCMYLFANGQWSSLKCHNELRFICEGGYVEIESQCKSQPAPIINVYINNNQQTTVTNGSVGQSNEDCSCNNPLEVPFVIERRFGGNDNNNN